MFTGLETAQNRWLTALLLLWAAFLFGGFAFGRLNAERTRRMPTWTRMASSFTLVVAAWSGVVFSGRTNDNPSGLFIAIGMTLGFIGDLFMAKLIPTKNYVLGGIGAFGLGHVAYIVQFLLPALNGAEMRCWAWVVWLVIGAALWYLVVFRGQKPTALHWAAFPYALLLIR